VGQLELALKGTASAVPELPPVFKQPGGQ